MKKQSLLEKFGDFQIQKSTLRRIVGGLCSCKQAAPYACQAGGYSPGTGAFANCMGDIYNDCDTYDPSC